MGDCLTGVSIVTDCLLGFDIATSFNTVSELEIDYTVVSFLGARGRLCGKWLACLIAITEVTGFILVYSIKYSSDSRVSNNVHPSLVRTIELLLDMKSI